jgi:hypothetical protein
MVLVVKSMTEAGHYYWKTPRGASDLAVYVDIIQLQPSPNYQQALESWLVGTRIKRR